MAVNRQKRKHYLSVHRLIVTVDRQKLSFRIERNQTVTPFLFLILKTAFDPGRRRSAPQGTLATAAARWDRREPLRTSERRVNLWITLAQSLLSELITIVLPW
jgi:hypothetical protein